MERESDVEMNWDRLGLPKHKRETSEETSSPLHPNPPPLRRRASNVSINSARHARVSSYGAETDVSSVEDMSERYKSNIRVVVRKRPRRIPLEKEEIDVVKCDGTQNIAIYEPKLKVDMTRIVEPSLFQFDYVFDERCNNNKIYEECGRPLIEAMNRGENAITFAFGQTGSGKTHTMFGSNDTKEPGLFSLCSRDVFASLKGMRLFVSFYEIYGSKLFDLLNDRASVQTRQDEYKNLHLIGLTEHDVRDHESLIKLIESGTSQRASGSTHANDRSSRSHAVMVLTTKTRRELRVFGKMTFVDLAGSERAADTKGMDKKTRMEGAEINKSLLALKECIRALDQKRRHVPFRGSKLTQVLRDSFVGDSTTLMISNVSPCQAHCEDTLNTLRYANRIKELKPPGEGEAGYGYLAPIPCANCGAPIWSNTKEQHVCLKVMEKCQFCRKQIDKAMMDQHKQVCSDAAFNCPHCGLRCLQTVMKKHKKKCGKAPVPCPNCGSSVIRDNLTHHTNTQCPNARIPCIYCRALVQRCDMDTHCRLCGACPVNCPNCNAVIRRSKLEEHHQHCIPPIGRLNRQHSRVDPLALGADRDAAGAAGAKPTKGLLDSPTNGALMRAQSKHQAGGFGALAFPEGNPINSKLEMSPPSMGGGNPAARRLSQKRAGHCPNCGKVVSQHLREQHLADCPAAVVSCPFSELGCKAKTTRSKLSAHIRDNLAVHMELMKTHAHKLEQENLKLRHMLAKAGHEAEIHDVHDAKEPDELSDNGSIHIVRSNNITPLSDGSP
jgi:kinesin family protein 2/24